MNSDFLIMGAGVAGLAAAQALLLQGASVSIVERGALGMESSWAGGGILAPLCPWDYAGEVTRLTGLGAAMYPQWVAGLHAATGIDSEYEVSGMLVLPPFDRKLARQWCDEHGLMLADKDGGLLLPEVAQVRNPRLIQALRKHVEILGGRIVEQCEVRGIEVRGGRVQAVTTSGGEFSADRYIVSAGAWSKQVLGQYALKLDIKPMRGQMLLFKFDTPPLPHIVLQDGMYLIPRRDGHLLVGSTLEDVGFDKRTTTEARDSLQQRAERLLPALHNMPLVQHWSGLRPASPGNIPTIGRHPQLENLYLNSGHFRYGVTMAPASAAILLNELYGVEQPFDVSVYRAGWSA
ncbi:MAG TPA: FAD-dependent oxidoreductase [Gallionellaceae bacterium]|nr:FAD-dependent oxidoreductase [Gallionellaceae bacterium]HQS73737.1 FAD-dependent oxidoreductase [Gallionellaceae bacterium]